MQGVCGGIVDVRGARVLCVLLAAGCVITILLIFVPTRPPGKGAAMDGDHTAMSRHPNRLGHPQAVAHHHANSGEGPPGAGLQHVGRLPSPCER